VSTPHRLEVRVYYEDTDAGGIVYHANYLRFAERGRTEMLRAQGWDHPTLRREHGGLFAVQRCALVFRRPAMLDDLLAVETSVRRATGARLELDQRICRGDETLVEIEVMLAFLDERLRPRRLPGRLGG
jgi:acyl-CoA thioester hydrolase